MSFSSSVTMVLIGSCKIFLYRLVKLLRRPFNLIILLSFAIFIILFYNISNPELKITTATKANRVRNILADFRCPVEKAGFSGRKFAAKREFVGLGDKPVLVIVENPYSPLLRQILDVLRTVKVDYDTTEVGADVVQFVSTKAAGAYSLIVFENYERYLNLPSRDRSLFDEYVIGASIGLVGFFRSRLSDKTRKVKVRGFALSTRPGRRFRKLAFYPASSLLRIAKSAVEINVPNRRERSDLLDTQIIGNFSSFSWRPESNLTQGFEPILLGFAEENPKVGATVVLSDNGTLDRIRRVIFGQNLAFWPLKVAFLDALHALSGGKISLPLIRYLQIDIDDVFVAPSGKRMLTDDVQALIESQNRLRGQIPGFTYTLGFTGKFFKRGNEYERRADELMIENRDKFLWFPHFWNHGKAHVYNETGLTFFMEKNHRFAQFHKLPLARGYAIAPHHSGVYPTHSALYKAWRKVWTVKCTSTEEYPHLRPRSLRRGFIFDAVKVLPRHICGLFTHTLYADEYQGGFEKLKESIFGGDLFETLLLNPYLIFMTHSTNFGNDRLAIFTMENALSFVRCYTNLNFGWLPPARLAERYFETYPKEKLPLWENPCHDPRHLAIWSSTNKAGVANCTLSLPYAVILGPQKTGSTALLRFLELNSLVKSSKMSSSTFEEVQFFGHKRNYQKGLEWYLSHFQTVVGGKYFVEKSATYFDSSLAPSQVKAFLPQTKLVVILVEPGRRAYSWYQHMRSKGDETALKYSFEDVLFTEMPNSSVRTGKGGAAWKLWKLRERCIKPGKYAVHLQRWLAHFPPSQLLLVDGGKFVTEPARILAQLQQFLSLPRVLDYKKILRFDSKKGFYCAMGNKCLGVSKGRKYAEPSRNATAQLEKIFRPYNQELLGLIHQHELKTGPPLWLLHV